jgi:hypothetical protein
LRRSLRKFAASNDGSSTIEFVIVFMAFIAIMFFVVEVTLYLFFMASLEKAAEAGVRAVVVSPPVAAGVPMTIARDPNTGIFGRKCSLGGQCVPFDKVTCRGASPKAGEIACTPAQFTRVLNHMKGFNAGVDPANVKITYQDVGIGFAGGPTVPMVTVTIEDVPYQTGILGLLLGDVSGLATLPKRSASMTGEDLAQ